MTGGSILDDNFTIAVRNAVGRARTETLNAGVAVFYRNEEGIEVLEQSDGRKFEVRFLSGVPRDRTYEILIRAEAR